jgi:hypothetical protein
MAAAGFTFTPLSVDEGGTEEDDTATCFHCGLTLSGWEVDDKPLQVFSFSVLESHPYIILRFVQRGT